MEQVPEPSTGDFGRGHQVGAVWPWQGEKQGMNEQLD